MIEVEKLWRLVLLIDNYKSLMLKDRDRLDECLLAVLEGSQASAGIEVFLHHIL